VATEYAVAGNGKVLCGGRARGLLKARKQKPAANIVRTYSETIARIREMTALTQEMTAQCREMTTRGREMPARGGEMSALTEEMSGLIREMRIVTE